MACPKAALFDLDDTLAESFKPPAKLMIKRLLRLLDTMPVAIITAASFQRMERQFLNEFVTSPSISQLYLFANVATECFTWNDGWQKIYEIPFTTQQHDAIRAAIHESVAEIGLVADSEDSPLILERAGKIAYAALGFNASQEKKSAWDPTRAKRIALRDTIRKRIDFAEVSVGGATTVDITPKGVDKAYGVRWLAKRLAVAPSEMLYVGDAFFEYGNDACVIPTGIQTCQVSGPDETLKIIDDILAACAAQLR